MNYLVIVLGSGLVASVLFNIIMVWYAKRTLLKVNTVYTASEEATDIFTMIDSFKEHLKTVYEMPTFYGDETLHGLLEHAKDMTEYLKKYEKVYSFTQPDLEEQLLAASEDVEKYEN